MKDETFKKVMDVLIDDGCTPLDCVELVDRMVTYIKNIPSDKPRTTEQDVEDCRLRWELMHGHTGASMPAGYVEKVTYSLATKASTYRMSDKGELVKAYEQKGTSTTFAHVITSRYLLYASHIGRRKDVTRLAIWAPFESKPPTGTQTAPMFREDV